MAKVVRSSLIPEPKWGSRSFDLSKWNQECDKVIKKLRKESDRAIENRLLVGRLLTLPVADGYAWYRVKSEKPLTIEYLPYSDGYEAHPILLRNLTKEDVLDLTIHEYRIRQSVIKKTRKANA